MGIDSKSAIAFLLLTLSLISPAYPQDINSELIEAAKNGQTGKVQSLLKAGADPNARNIFGLTALMQGSQVDTAQALLDGGADVNAKHREHGGTALDGAALNGYTDKVQVLLARGADVNAKDNYGVTALMLAASRGPTEIVRALLSAGANVNARADNGGTALSRAAKKGHGEIVRLLEEAGAEKSRDMNSRWLIPLGAVSLLVLVGVVALGRKVISDWLKKRLEEFKAKPMQCLNCGYTGLSVWKILVAQKLWALVILIVSTCWFFLLSPRG